MAREAGPDLVPTDGAHAAESVVEPGSGGGPAGPRLAVLAALAVIVALVVVAVVTGGGSDDGSGEAASSTTAATPAATAGTSTGTDAPDPSRRITTTTAVATTRAPGPYLAPAQGVELVFAGRERTLLTVDLGTGATGVIGTPIDVSGPAGGVQLVGEHVIVVAGPPWTVSLVDGSVDPLEVDVLEDGVCGLVPGDAGRVWFNACGGLTDLLMVEYSLADHAETNRIQLPTAAESAPGHAPGLGLYVLAPGGVFVVPPGAAPYRVETGRFVAAVGTQVLVLACDEGFTCGARLTDVATGSSRPVTVAVDGVLSGYFTPFGSLAAAGGRTLLRVYGPEGSTVAVLDVETATVTPLPEGTFLGPDDAVVWSPDGEWLFLQSTGGRVDAYHVDDGTMVEIDDLPRGRLLAARTVGAAPEPQP
jgi:hypothetical protein